MPVAAPTRRHMLLSHMLMLASFEGRRLTVHVRLLLTLHLRRLSVAHHAGRFQGFCPMKLPAAKTKVDISQLPYIKFRRHQAC